MFPLTCATRVRPLESFRQSKEELHPVRACWVKKPSATKNNTQHA